MAIGDDFEITNGKDIRHVSGATNYTVLELHRWLQDLADDASLSSDDFIDITRDTPSDKAFDTIITLINGYNIDDDAAEHLYNGSIIQYGGDEIYDGIQVVAVAGAHMEIIQNGALVTPNFWTTGLNADAGNGISHQFMLKVRTAAADIDGRRIIATTREFGANYGERRINGTSRGVNVIALAGADNDLNNETAEGTVATWTDVVNSNQGYIGIDVNNDAVDEFYYSEWTRDSRTINQFYERLKWLTRRGTAETLYGLSGALFRGITHEIVVDTPTGTFDPFEAVSWPGGTGQMLAINSPTAATRMWIQLLTGIAPTNDQLITAASTATALVNVTVTERNISTPFVGVSTGSAIIGAYGLGITELDLTASDLLFDLTNTPIQPPNFVTFSVLGLEDGEDRVTVAAAGLRFNYDDEAVANFVVGETLTFVTPAGTAVLAELRDLGSVGEMIIGPMLTGSPPVNNTTMTGGTSGATAAVNGTPVPSINKRQLINNALLDGAAVTSVVVTTAIPADTPNSGNIRIRRANGAYTLHPYSAWTSSTFTITSHDFSSNNALADDNIYIAYIDQLVTGADFLSFTGVYTADRNLFVRVRDGGVTPIKTFESPAVLGSAGGSSTAVRTPD